MIKIAPSILSADFGKLGEHVKLVEEEGADMIHIDVMDGHFVPNITMGPVVINSIRPLTSLPFDVHLMIQNPDKFLKDFAEAGSDIITVHVEAEHSLPKTIRKIRKLGKEVGISLNPATPFSKVIPHLKFVDLLLIMTVNPGFAGQKFMPSLLPKIKEARRFLQSKELKVDLEVDGGINPETAPLAVGAGANIIVAGSSIFSGDIKRNMKALIKSFEQYNV